MQEVLRECTFSASFTGQRKQHIPCQRSHVKKPLPKTCHPSPKKFLALKWILTHSQQIRELSYSTTKKLERQLKQALYQFSYTLLKVLAATVCSSSSCCYRANPALWPGLGTPSFIHFSGCISSWDELYFFIIKNKKMTLQSGFKSKSVKQKSGIKFNFGVQTILMVRRMLPYPSVLPSWTTQTPK